MRARKHISVRVNMHAWTDVCMYACMDAGTQKISNGSCRLPHEALATLFPFEAGVATARNHC